VNLIDYFFELIVNMLNTTITSWELNPFCDHNPLILTVFRNSALRIL